MSVTEEIKSRLDIVDVVSESVSLRKSGKNYAGFCPFHPNSRTPAFYVFPDTQTWYCFGACAEGGDLFAYVMKKEGWDFREALENLARRAGVTLEERTPAQKEKQRAVDKQVDLLTAAADYFHMLLLHAPEAKAARHYVEERGLNQETIEAFKLGFALNSWEACRNHFNGQGYDDEELLRVGLLSHNEERGTRYDRFRNRLMIPIRNGRGRVVGFGARTLEKDGIPKYLNSPQTDLFDKSNLLYGLDMAKRFIRQEQQVVIVEGYMDVMQGWQAGFRNIVAQMGTALTETQLRQLKRYTKTFVLALDADAAGTKATLRGLQVARQTLDHEYDISFDARGLIRHEARLEANIQIATLPEGRDPDQIMRQNPEAWPKLLAKAKPVVAYMIELATRDLDLDDAKAKSAAARRVIPLIKDLKDPVERDHYWHKLAGLLKTTVRALQQLPVDEGPSSSRYRSAARPQVAPETKKKKKENTAVSPTLQGDRRELYYLRQCIGYPQLLLQVNEELQTYDQPVVSARDFSVNEDKELLQQMYTVVEQGTFVTEGDLCDSLEDTVLLERVQRLRHIALADKVELERLPNQLAQAVLKWRRDKISQEVTRLAREMQEPHDDDTLQFYWQRVGALTRQKRDLDRAINAMSPTSRRRAAEAEANGRY